MRRYVVKVNRDDRGRDFDHSFSRQEHPVEIREGGDYHQHIHHHHHAGGEDAVHSEYADSLNEVVEELENKPADWSHYGKALADLLQIVALEFSQLETAKNSGDRRSIKEELEDLAAACIHAHKNM